MQGKIHPMPHKEVVKILLKNGFQSIKTKGPHLKFRKDTGSEVLTTLVSHCEEIQPTIIKCIVRQSRKHEEEFY